VIRNFRKSIGRASEMAVLRAGALMGPEMEVLEYVVYRSCLSLSTSERRTERWGCKGAVGGSLTRREVFMYCKGTAAWKIGFVGGGNNMFFGVALIGRDLERTQLWHRNFLSKAVARHCKRPKRPPKIVLYDRVTWRRGERVLQVAPSRRGAIAGKNSIQARHRSLKEGRRQWPIKKGMGRQKKKRSSETTSPFLSTGTIWARGTRKTRWTCAATALRKERDSFIRQQKGSRHHAQAPGRPSERPCCVF